MFHFMNEENLFLNLTSFATQEFYDVKHIRNSSNKYIFLGRLSFT